MNPRHPVNFLRSTSLVLAAVVALVASGCSLFSQRTEVLFIGDSIMNQTAPFLTGQLSAQPGVGPVDTRVIAKNGTGLLTPELYDWVGRAPTMAANYRPKVVVVQFIGNYTDGTETPLWKTADGREVAPYTDEFWTAWGEQASVLTSAFEAKGAKVFWILPIPIPGDEGRRREDALRATYEGLTARHPRVGFVDGRAALGGAGGEWVWSRPGIDGTDVTVRVADGLHVTEDGGRLLARQIAEAVAPALIEARGAAR